MTFNIVVATDLENGIGLDGKMPWLLKQELAYFKTLTLTSKTRNAVIMGRKTWESLPDSVRPLPGRLNIVLSRHFGNKYPKEVLTAPSLEEALNLLNPRTTDQVFVMGGGQLYAEAIRHPSVHTLYLTLIQKKFHCDTWFPNYKENFVLKAQSEPQKESDLTYLHQIWTKKN